MSHNGTGKPTINGIVKGRPGKGRVLSLGQRAFCYAKHRMTDENTFRYHKRIWCKTCRAASRKRSAVKRLVAAKAEAARQRKEANATLDTAHRSAALVRTGKGKAKAKVSGKVKVACCGETFPDAPTASKHIIGCEKGKAEPAKGKPANRKAA